MKRQTCPCYSGTNEKEMSLALGEKNDVALSFTTILFLLDFVVIFFI
jgi:hypothetical protein